MSFLDDLQVRIQQEADKGLRSIEDHIKNQVASEGVKILNQAVGGQATATAVKQSQANSVAAAVAAAPTAAKVAVAGTGIVFVIAAAVAAYLFFGSKSK